MRPLQLKLKGINSYREEQIIDFETLTSQGLFGIFGPTGSGKSTILDAMTLALYAKLPRDTKNFINTNETSASVSFLFSITTDRTRKYLAERSFRYHNNTYTSTVHNTTGRLIVYDGETETVLADKPTEVTAECIRLLGLTSEDFMRTVVLPQGQFSEFLHLKNKERRIMLQRIFHLEKYGIELTSKIGRAKQKQELLLSTLAGERKNFEDISPAQLSKLKKQEERDTKQYSRLSKKLTKLEKSFQETEELYNTQQELLPLKEAKKEKELLLPSIKEKENNLDITKKANQLRPFSIQVSNAQTAYKQACEKLESSQKEAASLQAHFEKTEKEYQAATTAQKEELPLLQAKEQLLHTAQSAADTIHTWKQAKDNAQKELNETLDSLIPLKEQQEKHSKKEQQLLSEILETEKSIEAEKISPERKQLLEKGNIMEETYREKRGNYETNANSLSTLKTEIEKESSIFSDQQKSLKDIYIQLCHRLSSLNEQHSAAQKELDVIKEKAEQNKQKQKSWQQNHMAQLLREELEEGALCPVCGTPYKEHSSQSHTTENVKTSSEPFSEITIKMDSEIPSETISKVTEKEASEASSETISKITERVNSEVTSKTISKKEAELSDISFKNLEKELKKLEKQQQTQQKLIQQLEQELYSLNTHISNLKDALEITDENTIEDTINKKAVPTSPVTVGQPIDYPSISRQISAYLQAKGELRRQKEQYEKQDADLKKQHSALQNYAKEIFALRKDNNIENFSNALETLKQKEDDRQQKEKAIKEKRQDLETLRLDIKTLSDKIATLENKSSSLTANIENCEKVISEQTERFPKTLSVDMDFIAEITKNQKRQQDINTVFKSTETDYQHSLKKLQQKNEELSSCQSTSHSSETHLKQVQKLYLTQKKKLGFSETDQPELYCMKEKELTKLEKEITSYYDDVRQNEERIRYLQEKLGKKKINEEKWNRQKEELADTRQQVKELESSILLLTHQIEVMTKDLEKKEELEQKWEKESHKKDMIKELEQLFKGNAFIEYVAQSKLSYIAREASVILSKISGGNYALEINDSSEFIIRDNKNGGAVRPSDTLSGGELFITSLSLALALSSSIQLNGAAPLEFFFLDEGFGSLDDDLLDTVMNSLERLQSKKRSIGIISHVEAIQARVPLKLLVTPSDLSQKGSQIRLEYS